ncbi:hypothetical protein [Shimia abyssi]|uniref:Uncharacterized protein n=1 Tax=Shimia abyssi TaxID=1662395 RepID=A0A2P8FFH8_9RHOB|nr:hypothetical protein [Shimia abyssi]PSL20463.1 hypothetical protein CLV88_103105 [Shimia abyssi]
MTHVERIDALTRNARSTWFGLLSALLFVGITLMGVEHIDFYGVNRATDLPLINVSVPTPLFFYAAPVLTAAIYGYFHLYLIRLWDALGEAPSRPDGYLLGNAIAPWLVTDAALHLRNRLRGDNCTTPRALEGAAMLLNILLAWGFGLFILTWLWIESMTARNLVMTLIAAISLLAAALSAYASLRVMWYRMNGDMSDSPARLFRSPHMIAAIAIAVPSALTVTYARTTEPIFGIFLAPIDLTGQDIVDPPTNWRPYDIARAEYLDTWCKRAMNTCVASEAPPVTFEAEWKTRRSTEIALLKKPS